MNKKLLKTNIQRLSIINILLTNAKNSKMVENISIQFSMLYKRALDKKFWDILYFDIHVNINAIIERFSKNKKES